MKKSAGYLVTSFAIIAGSSAYANVESTGTNGFIVVNTVEVATPASQAWDALVSNVDQWWPKDHSWWNGTFTIEPQAGGCFCEVSGARSAEHLRVSFVDPEQRLVMTGGLGPLQSMGMYGALDWQFIQPSPEQTTITLRYHVQGFNENGYAELALVVDKVQAIQLNALANYLKSR